MLTYYLGPEGARVRKVSPPFFNFCFFVFRISCSVTKPKLGLSLGTKVKILWTLFVVVP